MPKFISTETLAKQVAYSQVADGFDISKHLKATNQGGQQIYEYIGADDFGSEWYERTRFEVDAGRMRVPTLYESIYDVIVDAGLPETMNLKNWGQGGFALEEVFEGGEAKFGQITTSEATVTQRQFAVGLEYTKKLVMFNQMWQIARIERMVGEAYNALLNHLHLSPILTYTYAPANQTAAVTSGTTTTEDWFLTLEAAVMASMSDTSNPRNGPYVLLTHPAHQFMWERVFNRVPQAGFALDSSAGSSVQSIVAYNGWTGTRGHKTYSYAGVPSTKAYLINLGYRDQDFVSLVKQPLEAAMGNPDVSRFIREQIVWDVWLGIYSNPLRAVEEITLPT
jgi:hypothetical protein